MIIKAVTGPVNLATPNHGNEWHTMPRLILGSSLGDDAAGTLILDLAVQERMDTGKTVLRRRLVVSEHVTAEHRPRFRSAIERMEHTGIGVEFERLVGPQLLAVSLAACRRITPVVGLARQHQERHRPLQPRLIAWSVIIDRGPQPDADIGRLHRQGGCHATM